MAELRTGSGSIGDLVLGQTEHSAPSLNGGNLSGPESLPGGSLSGQESFPRLLGGYPSPEDCRCAPKRHRWQGRARQNEGKCRATICQSAKAHIRTDGRKIHAAYVFEVTKAEEAKYPGDY